MKKARRIMLLVLLCCLVLFKVSAGGAQEGKGDQAVTISMWHQFTTGGAGGTAAGPAFDKIFAMWQAKNPNVKFETTILGPMEIRDQMRLALAANKAPDLFYTWPEGGVVAGYAADGLLYDMTADAKRLGWFKKFNPTALDTVTQKGKLYGLPSELEYPVIYYNTMIFDKLGLKEPTTYKEFLALLDKLKTTEYIPVTVGNGDKWQLPTVIFDGMRAVTYGKAKVDDLYFGSTKWVEFEEAANEAIRWIDKGYFPDGINGISYTDANKLLTSGKAAISCDGTWITQDLLLGAEKGVFEMGVFPWPNINEKLPPTALTGAGSHWSISSKASAQVKKISIEFIDSLYKPEAVKIWLEEGALNPANVGIDYNAYNLAPYIKKIYQMSANREYAQYTHTLVPENVVQVFYNDGQSWVGKDITSKEWLRRMDVEWEKARAEGKLWNPRP
jgi:raffinose/stachyose/melibiose transport system substrate-binding protein